MARPRRRKLGSWAIFAATCKTIEKRLLAKGRRYWVSAALVLIFSYLATPYIYDYLHLADHRARLFQYSTDKPRPLEPRFVKVILIGDDEYWKGYPAGRRPIKRDYLARLVNALDAANAQVIALDFDVRLPDPAVAAVSVEYKAETDKLIRAILHAADDGKNIVLPRTIRFDAQGRYALDPDIYQPYGICTGFDKTGAWQNPGTSDFPIGDPAKKNIACGYIALYDDVLALPGRLRLADGSELDSFALAVAKAKNADAAAGIGDNASYVNYIAPERMQALHAIFSAHDLLNDPLVENKRNFGAQAVIVGAGWSSFADHRGYPVDLHHTPVGSIAGALLHDNFAEAVLDSRVFPALPNWLVWGLEGAFGVFAAIVFAPYVGFLATLLSFIGLTAALIAVQWFMIHMFGVFFDAFIPLIGLALHSLYDAVIHR
jgi:CHASE2 domain-containing sensor protein